MQAELDRVVARFGVDGQQVRRDHLISHVLAALSQHLDTDDVVFIGGTALSRTHLADARLSEDIDLVALGHRGRIAHKIETAVARSGIARSHGRPAWRPPPSTTRGSQPAVLMVPDGTSIQVQLLAGDGYRWPTEVVSVEQRYSDAAPAVLRVLTSEGFAATKLTAWLDRRAPRDLYDMWAMSRRGLITAQAARVFAAHGPFGRVPAIRMFEPAPSVPEWTRALAHQTNLTIGPQEAADIVTRAWRNAASDRARGAPEAESVPPMGTE